MKNNTGNIDRIIRLLFAAVIALLYFTRRISGTTAMIAGIIAIVLAATALTGSCPLYRLFRFSTKKNNRP